MSKIFGYGTMGAAVCFLGALLGELVLHTDRWFPAGREEVGPTEILFHQDRWERPPGTQAGAPSVEITLAWNNDNDLDLHCIEPSGEEISCDHRQSATGGFLDVDRNDAPPFVSAPVEHIFWQSPCKPPQGKYRVVVAHRARHKGPDPTSFICEVVVKGNVKEASTRKFTGTISQGQTLEAGAFEVETRPAPRPTDAAIAQTALIAALWTALLALPFSLALLIIQNRSLRLSPRLLAVVLAGSLLTGLLAGGAGQALSAIFEPSDAPQALARLLPPGVQAELGRLLGWLVLGGLLGLGLTLFVPQLPRLRAVSGGVLGGAAAAWASVVLARTSGDPAAHWVSAALLGLFIGSTIALARRAAAGDGDSLDASAGASGPSGLCLHLPARAAIPLCEGRPLTTADLPGTEAGSGVTAAEVIHNPHDPTVYGLTNRTRQAWSATLPSGETHQVDPGRTIRLTAGTRINFGPVAGTLSAGQQAVSSKPARPAFQGAAVLAGLMLLGGLALGDWFRRCSAQVEPSRVTDPVVTASATGAPAGGMKAVVLKGHTEPVFSVAFSPDGRVVASASGDRTIRLWRVADGSLVHVLKGHRDGVHSVAFHPDGTLLASCGLDQTIRLWNAAFGQPVRTIENVHPGGIAFTPDGAFLAGVATDGRLQFWRTSDGQVGQVFDGWVLDPVFDSRGAHLVGRTQQSLQIWDVRSRRCVRRLTGLRGAPHCVSWNRDGTLIAAGQCRVDAADEQTGGLVEKPDPEFFHLYAADGHVVRALVGHSNCVTCTAFSRMDRPLLASGSSDRTIKIWRVPDGEVLATLLGHSKEVWSVAFSPDGRLLASGGNDWTVRLWHLPDPSGARAAQPGAGTSATLTAGKEAVR